MSQDLSEQGFGHRPQIDQVDRSTGAFCHGFDEGNLLRSGECAAGSHRNVDIAFRALTAARDRTEQHGQFDLRKLRQHRAQLADRVALRQ